MNKSPIYLERNIVIAFVPVNLIVMTIIICIRALTYFIYTQLYIYHVEWNVKVSGHLSFVEQNLCYTLFRLFYSILFYFTHLSSHFACAKPQFLNTVSALNICICYPRIINHYFSIWV